MNSINEQIDTNIGTPSLVLCSSMCTNETNQNNKTKNKNKTKPELQTLKVEK